MANPRSSDAIPLDLDDEYKDIPPPPPPRESAVHAKKRVGISPILVLIVLLLAAAGFGAFYLLEHRPAAEARDALTGERQERQGLANQVETLTGERDRLQGELEALRASEAALRAERDQLARESETLRTGNEQAQAALAAMQEAQAALRERLAAELASGDVELRGGGANELSVAVGDRVLFGSGQATLNPRGEEVLGRVVAALGSVSDRRIRIEGHTDAAPVASDGAFPTNWELSTARATTVVRFLETQGIAGDRLVAVGYGPHRPVGDNRTANGRQRNRRIEIVLERESRPPG